MTLLKILLIDLPTATRTACLLKLSKPPTTHTNIDQNQLFHCLNENQKKIVEQYIY